MVTINALIPRQRLFDGIPTSIPFTYRDGLTTLQLIECLRHNLDITQRDLSKVEEATADLAASVDKAFAGTLRIQQGIVFRQQIQTRHRSGHITEIDITVDRKRILSCGVDGELIKYQTIVLQLHRAVIKQEVSTILA